MPTKEKNPKQVTVWGRLSFPSFTAQAAYELSQKGQYKAKDVASAAPHFELVLEQTQFDKLTAHVKDVFLPYCVAQSDAGEKKDVLDKKEAADLLKQIKPGAFDGPYNTPFKEIGEKTAELAPEGICSLKVIGNKGTDMELKAIVQSEDELLQPDPDQLDWPTIRPLGATVHQMYPGCYVGVTLNLYAYHNGKHPGFSAGGSVAVFRADGERFGGGVTVDEDEIFAD